MSDEVKEINAVSPYPKCEACGDVATKSCQLSGLRLCPGCYGQPTELLLRMAVGRYRSLPILDNTLIGIDAYTNAINLTAQRLHHSVTQLLVCSYAALTKRCVSIYGRDAAFAFMKLKFLETFQMVADNQV